MLIDQAGSVDPWFLAIAVTSSMIGTSLGKLLLEKLSDKQFRGTWEADGREELGREVRAREALARVGRGAPREISHDDLQLLRLLATGLPMDSVARRLDLSERTVRRRTRAACDRLGFGTAVEAIVWAARRGLL